MSTVGHVSADQIQLVTFDVGDDRFALDIMRIVQILRYEGSTEIPRAPDFVQGIIVLRDQVIPIIDLLKRLFAADLDRDEIGDDERVLIVRLGVLTAGLRVDRVRKIITIESAQVLPAPGLVQGDHAQFLQGVVRVDDAVVLLVDLERVLSEVEKKQVGASIA